MTIAASQTTQLRKEYRKARHPKAQCLADHYDTQMYPAIQVCCRSHYFFHRRPHGYYRSVKDSFGQDRRPSARKQRR